MQNFLKGGLLLGARPFDVHTNCQPGNVPGVGFQRMADTERAASVEAIPWQRRLIFFSEFIDQILHLFDDFEFLCAFFFTLTAGGAFGRRFGLPVVELGWPAL